MMMITFPKFAVWSVALPVLFIVMVIYQGTALDLIKLRWFSEGASTNFTPLTAGYVNDSFQTTGMLRDKTLGGLLAPNFDQVSCLSRYQSVLYRKSSPYKPSSYLISKLRSYEELHKRCGPHSESYKRSIKQLLSGQIDTPVECQYVVWTADCGLGNRILSIASAFLYALLTNRVLLINQESDMAGLFCEPFPDTSWLLPMDFLFKNQIKRYKQKYEHSYGNMLKHNTISSSTQSLPPYLYLHLSSDGDHHDKLFYCDQDQTLLGKIPWLLMKSNLYFTPSLFLISSFEQELSMLFPNKETVFHHLGRYLFQPSNQVWKLITGYYQEFLARADERIGIQIRVFDKKASPFQSVMDQILTCTRNEKLLPEVDMAKSIAATSENHISKAVLITSLFPGYFEKMKTMYRKHPTINGEVIDVYQPSYEKKQRTKNNLHNMKAWAEIYLLSLTDVLVTSASSTFGYVAQGLAGLKPVILYKIEKQKIPDPPCGQGISMEPCFHAAPDYDCKPKSTIDTASVPHLRQCEDIRWGLKLFNSYE